MLNFYILGVLQVNSVSVGAICRRRYRNVGNFDTPRAVKFQVALWAVHDCDVADSDIVAGIESQSLLRETNIRSLNTEFCPVNMEVTRKKLCGNEIQKITVGLISGMGLDFFCEAYIRRKLRVI